MVASTLAPQTQNAATSEDLVLRVCGSSRDGQVVRLASPKCTIGSAEQCTLRLRARSVARVHCLILRGPNGTVVRRWSPDTRLNGAAFDDASLTAGDRLSVGGIDLEVVATGQSAERSKAAPPAPMPQSDAEPAALRHRAQEWEAKLQETERRLHAQGEHLRARAAELDARTEELDARAAELAIRTKDADSRAAGLDAAVARLAEDREALESDRRQWEAERTEREAELDRRARELDARELDARAAEPSLPVELLKEEPEFETPNEEAPVDLAEVFRKIGAKPVLPEEEAEAEEARPARHPVRGKLGLDEPAARPATEPKPAKPDHEDEDGSIDDYMAQLLQRMRSPGGQAAAPSAGPSRPAAIEEAPDASAADPSEPTSQPLPPGRRKPAQMSPMAVAPEKQGGLSAMRELANMSAQTALHRHARGQTKKAARGKLIVAALGLLAGGLLLVLWFHWHAGPLAFLAAMAGLAIGVLWGLQWAFLTGHLIVNKGRIKWESKPAKGKETPPVAQDTPEAPASAAHPQAVEPSGLAGQTEDAAAGCD